MDGPFHPRAYSVRPTGSAARLPLPRPVLRRLLHAGRLRVGSRVLLVGEHAGELAGCLAWLGISSECRPMARGFDEDDGHFDALVWWPEGGAAERAIPLVSEMANALDSVGVVLAVLHAPRGTIVSLAAELGRRLSAGTRPIVHHVLASWSLGGLFPSRREHRIAHGIIACLPQGSDGSLKRRAA